MQKHEEHVTRVDMAHSYTMDGRFGHTGGTDASDQVALNPLPAVTGRGAVQAELQGRTAAVTAGSKRMTSCEYITALKF